MLCCSICWYSKWNCPGVATYLQRMVWSIRRWKFHSCTWDTFPACASVIAVATQASKWGVTAAVRAPLPLPFWAHAFPRYFILIDPKRKICPRNLIPRSNDIQMRCDLDGSIPQKFDRKEEQTERTTTCYPGRKVIESLAAKCAK